jgi:CBS domain-containing protein
MTVGEICNRQVVTADPEESVVDAARHMREHHVGDVVVVDRQRRPLGVLTDRDIVVSAVAQSPDQLTTLLVKDLMSVDVATVQERDGLDEALRKMRTRGVRRLPVVSRDRHLEGILALDDILGVMSDEWRDLVTLVAREQKRERAVRV